MEKNKHTKGIATVLLFLCVTPGPTRAQSSTPSPMPPPPAGAPVIPPMRDSQPTDAFAGLKFTFAKKSKMNQIHQDMRSLKPAMSKDHHLTVEKGAPRLDR